MALLDGKRILVTGLLSNRSIAYGIARAARREGAESPSPMSRPLQGTRNRSRQGFQSDAVYPCDVASDAQIAALFESLRARWGALDGLVHAIGFAQREAISGELLDGLSREAFREAHDISAYSFPALAKAALPLMEGRSGALLTLTYLGSAGGWCSTTTPWASPRRASKRRSATCRRTSGPRASA